MDPLAPKRPTALDDWASRFRIAVAVKGLSKSQKNRLRATLPAHEISFLSEASDEGARKRLVVDSEIMFGNVPLDWLKEATSLRWIQLDSAGFDSYLPLATRAEPLPVLISNLNDFYGEAVAEALLTGILSMYRQLPALLAAQRAGRWIKDEVESSIRHLHGSRVVVLGAGSLGRAIGTLAAAFRCRVDYFARSSPIARLRNSVDLDRELPEADLLVNTLPQTPLTVGLLDRSRLLRLPSRAVFVNGGRGSVVDETALVELLRNNRLAGAVLDVTQIEPLPAGHPFWALPNVILSQHTGGRFPAEIDTKVTRFLLNMERFAAHQPLIGAVDAIRGY